jgi:hypothetical protein
MVPGNRRRHAAILHRMRARFVIAAGTLTLGACNWLSLGANAVRYETMAAGEAANIVVRDSLAYVAIGDSGLAVVSVRNGRRLLRIDPPAGSESVDDVAIADGLLFVLDARPPGHLAALSLADPLHPTVASAPARVPIAPFSGVSAAAGVCVVSGGTSILTVWRYDPRGALRLVDSTDLGRGQPDVLVATDGTRAWVSTHYWGPYFGLDAVVFDSVRRVTSAWRLALRGAGFTAGGARPANFPIDVAQLDDSTLLVAHERGLGVIDLAGPHAPTLARVIDVGGPAVSVDALGREAAVSFAGATSGLAVIDFGASEPRVVRRVTFARGTKPAGVALSTRTVMVAARGQGVLVVQR